MFLGIGLTAPISRFYLSAAFVAIPMAVLAVASYRRRMWGAWMVGAAAGVLLLAAPEAGLPGWIRYAASVPLALSLYAVR